mmetsp:Transcript_30146/g.75887  ORF Transcript_30146/g.75887 Transcript_30146/m.75887 type:complete len:237 (-) Transcript_30146:108-818(-)
MRAGAGVGGLPARLHSSHRVQRAPSYFFKALRRACRSDSTGSGAAGAALSAPSAPSATAWRLVATLVAVAEMGALTIFVDRSMPISSSTWLITSSLSSSSTSSSIASSSASFIISPFISIISLCLSNSIMIFCITPRFMVLFMRIIAIAVLWRAWPMACVDCMVCNRALKVDSCAFILYNFVICERVRTRSLAIILAASIWPCRARFLVSMIVFFSWFCSVVLSRSRSRIERRSMR